MKNINRIEKLEGVISPINKERKIVILITGEPEPIDIDNSDLIVWVVNEEARQMTYQLIGGEVTISSKGKDKGLKNKGSLS